jgi:hypothetical protein
LSTKIAENFLSIGKICHNISTETTLHVDFQVVANIGMIWELKENRPGNKKVSFWILG